MPESYLQQLQKERKARLKRFSDASVEKPPPPKQVVTNPTIEEENPTESIEQVLTRLEGNFKTIFKEVCRYYNISMLDVMSSRRTLKIAMARHVVAYIASQHTNLSLSQIALRLGRDRSTVSHAISRVKELMHTDRLPADIATIKQRLGI